MFRSSRKFPVSQSRGSKQKQRKVLGQSPRGNSVEIVSYTLIKHRYAIRGMSRGVYHKLLKAKLEAVLPW